MRRGELIANGLMLFGPFILGSVGLVAAGLAFALPELSLWLMTELLAVGFGLFLWARLSVLRKVGWLSVGPAGMSRGMRVAYCCGYALMALGAFLFLGFLFLAATRG
ncbi:MAG TPA: hypothetical protein PK668_12730 [Myxococcota bacterium]|nr:hypothetical protein [Myxococcota bacterium]HRY93664.1 hypothetical protein [Myxococcota bacterium]